MQKLLDSIALIHQQEADTLEVNGWFITRIIGGMNGLVYRAERDNGQPLAVKICKRDERNRAGREYASMQALHEAGCDVAPKVLYLAPEPAGLPGSVVISEWLPGETLTAYPTPGDHPTWVALLESLAQVHSLTPQESTVQLSNAMMYLIQPEDVLRELNAQLARLPHSKIGALDRSQFDHVLGVASQIPSLRWGHPVQIGLIHCDPNARNMILFEGEIRLVDWENSGWGDPAFDIADLCANPFYGMPLPVEHHAWMMDEHARLLDDPHLPQRAALYTRLLHVWWLMRNGRYLTEANNRLKGVQFSPQDAILEQQAIIWERTCTLFDLKNP